MAKLRKKDQKLLAAAQSDLSLGKYNAAATALTELLSRYPDQARFYFLRSVTHKERGDFASAITDIKTGMQQEKPVKAVTLKELGQLYARMGNYAEALTTYERYAATAYVNDRPRRKAAAERLVATARTAVQLAANPVPFQPEPLPGGVNTPDNLEYFPSISVDGARMIFTRRVGNQQEDFYLSERKEDGSWTTARPLASVNTEFNEGAQTITADGNLLIFTACGRPDGAGSCDLYYTQRDKEGYWTAARNLGAPVNTRDYEAQPSLSADGQYLFFTSRRPGSLGSEDIYVSRRTPSGKWSAPVNLGEAVNTSGREQYPFFAADGRTLYFTSDAHPGLGGQDLFRTTLQAQGTWTKPENLGYPINTADDETNLFVELNGATAYFSKGQRNVTTGKVDVDIYRFELPDEQRPAAATYVHARIVDASTGQPLVADVRLRTVGQSFPPVVRQSAADGQFTTVLPAGEDYALTIEKDGYLFYAERFALAEGFTQEDPYELEIMLEPIPPTAVVASDRAEADGAIAFRNVLFETGSAELLPVSAEELDRLVALLQQAPRFRVEIVGHTDDVGEEAANQALSERRAASVKVYLLGQGIADNRVQTLGLGESKPIADNATDAGRAKNRRTTFRLLE